MRKRILGTLLVLDASVHLKIRIQSTQYLKQMSLIYLYFNNVISTITD